MRPKTLILFVLAIGCGLVASIGISQVIEKRHQTAAPAVEKEPVYVALKDIKTNEPFTPENVKLDEWPKDRIPPDAIRDLKELENQRAGAPIYAGVPLRKVMFAVDGRMDEVPPGYKTMAVPADAVAAIGNLVQPGDRVDILVAVHRGDKSFVKTILQDVRVWAVNQQYRPLEDKSNETISAKTVSLLVTSEQAEKLALASVVGQVRLVLRNPADDQLVETAGATAADLLHGEQNDRQEEWNTSTSKEDVVKWLNNQPAETPEPEGFSMEILKGNSLDRVDFTRQGKDGRWVTGGAAPPPGPADPSPAPPPPANEPNPEVPAPGV